jgi:hypothetical protein
MRELDQMWNGAVRLGLFWFVYIRGDHMIGGRETRLLMYVVVC